MSVPFNEAIAVSPFATASKENSGPNGGNTLMRTAPSTPWIATSVPRPATVSFISIVTEEAIAESGVARAIAPAKTDAIILCDINLTILARNSHFLNILKHYHHMFLNNV